MHYETTGPEIWKQTGGKVDVVCFGVGSGGTVVGVGRYIREKNPNVRVYAVEPYESSVINGFQHSPHRIPGRLRLHIIFFVYFNSFQKPLEEFRQC